MLRPLLRSEVGEVSNRRAWHEPALLTAEVLEHYKRPLRARNWDAALVEVRRRLTMPRVIASGKMESQACPTVERWSHCRERDAESVMLVWEVRCSPGSLTSSSERGLFLALPGPVQRLPILPFLTGPTVLVRHFDVTRTQTRKLLFFLSFSSASESRRWADRGYPRFRLLGMILVPMFDAYVQKFHSAGEPAANGGERPPAGGPVWHRLAAAHRRGDWRLRPRVAGGPRRAAGRGPGWRPAHHPARLR